MKMKSKSLVMIAVGVVAIATVVTVGYYIWAPKNKTSKETYEDLVRSDHVDVNVLLQGPKKTNV
jgi:flagellar basal body-associated protein FliL